MGRAPGRWAAVGGILAIWGSGGKRGRRSHAGAAEEDKRGSREEKEEGGRVEAGRREEESHAEAQRKTREHAEKRR
jgi:hypothetical protein